MEEESEVPEEYTIIEETINEPVRNLILDGVEDYNRAYFKKKDPSTKIIPFVIYAKDKEGHVIGGVQGSTLERSSGGWVDIEFAWVDKEWRSYGIGTELFERLEAMGKAKGCQYMQVFTWAYQGVNFYKKLGFDRIGTMPKWVEGYDAVFFRKQI